MLRGPSKPNVISASQSTNKEFHRNKEQHFTVNLRSFMIGNAVTIIELLLTLWTKAFYREKNQNTPINPTTIKKRTLQHIIRIQEIPA